MIQVKGYENTAYTFSAIYIYTGIYEYYLYQACATGKYYQMIHP